MQQDLFQLRFGSGLTAMLLLCLFAIGGADTAVLLVKEKKAVRIALVSDTHTTRGTAEDQTLYKGHLDQVIAQVNQAKVDVILIAGDLTQGGKAQDQEDFKAQIKGFTAPVLFVPGNHDIGNKTTSAQPGTVTSDRIAAFEQSCVPHSGPIPVLGFGSWASTRRCSAAACRARPNSGAAG